MFIMTKFMIFIAIGAAIINIFFKYSSNNSGMHDNKNINIGDMDVISGFHRIVETSYFSIMVAISWLLSVLVPLFIKINFNQKELIGVICLVFSISILLLFMINKNRTKKTISLVIYAVPACAIMYILHDKNVYILYILSAFISLASCIVVNMMINQAK